MKEEPNKDKKKEEEDQKSGDERKSLKDLYIEALKQKISEEDRANFILSSNVQLFLSLNKDDIHKDVSKVDIDYDKIEVILNNVAQVVLNNSVAKINKSLGLFGLNLFIDRVNHENIILLDIIDKKGRKDSIHSTEDKKSGRLHHEEKDDRDPSPSMMYR